MLGKAEAVAARKWAARLVHPALLLLFISLLAYGLLLHQMGFYWDELPMSWIRYELGPEAMARYFSTNRPVWGLLYQATTRVFPQLPIVWEVFALLLRWLSSVLVWKIASSLWGKPGEFSALVALGFLLYPGFNQQWTSYLYSHFFIVLIFLLLSFLCSIWSERHPSRRIPLTVFGAILAGLNLWMLEYFFVLELLRPLLIWRMVILEKPTETPVRQARHVLASWLPYVLILLANAMWRSFVFNNQVYQPTLLSDLQANPLGALFGLGSGIAQYLYRTTLVAWAQIAGIPNLITDGPRTVAYYAAVVILTAAIVWILIVSSRRTHEHHDQPRPWPIGLGLIAILLAGGPFLLTGLEVTTAYPANRFTLPFMLGVSLLLAGLLMYLPRGSRLILTVALISLAGGRQALWAEDYRRDWNTQKALFWQMAWRAPGIEPNTIILLNEGALPLYADNSLIGSVNWIYDPGNRSGAMDYAVFYPTSRIGGTIPRLEPGLRIEYDFIAETFAGNTSQILSFYFRPPGCLRLLDPEIDLNNRLIPADSLMREAAALSSERWILPAGESRMPPLFYPEPFHGWCYYFEKAGLAAQGHDWKTVVDLGDTAFALQDHPNDPAERFVFIEGYAHTGAWERAVQLSDVSYRVSRGYVGPLLCQLWRRIEADTEASPDQRAAISEVKSMFACGRE